MCEFSNFWSFFNWFEVHHRVYLNWSNINLGHENFWHIWSLEMVARTFGAPVTGNLSQINCYIMALTKVTLSRTPLAIKSSTFKSDKYYQKVLLTNQIGGNLRKWIKNWLTSRPQSVLIMYILCENIYFTPSLNLLLLELYRVWFFIITGVAFRNDKDILTSCKYENEPGILNFKGI